MKRVGSALVVLGLSMGFSTPQEHRSSHYELRYVKYFNGDNIIAYATGGKGVIEGKVLYVGKRELRNKRKLITKDKEVCGRGYKIDKVYEVSEGGGVKNAVVFVEGGGKPRKVKKVLVQKNCDFVPRVIAMGVGSVLEIINEDPVKHEANGVQDFATIFQFSQHKKGMKDKVELKKAGVVEVTCNIHGWMKAWVVVVNSDYYAVTDEKGRFRIAGLPPGEYKIRLWHEGFGEKVKKVKVSEGKATTVTFELR